MFASRSSIATSASGRTSNSTRRRRVVRRNGAIMPSMVRDILELAGSLGFLDEISDEFHRQPDAIDPSWQALLSEAGRGAAPRPAANGAHGGAASHGRGNGQAAKPADGQAARPVNGHAANGQAAAAL